MTRFDNKWIEEKAKKFVSEDKERHSLLVRSISGKRARYLAWKIAELMSEKYPNEETLKNVGITISKLGRYYARSYYDKSPYFQFEYDYESREAYYVISHKEKMRSLEEEKKENKIAERIKKLVPESDLKLFQKQGDTSQKEMKDIKVITKLFNPTGAGTWYLYEKLDDDTYMCFANLGDIEMAELGTVSIKELAEFEGTFGLGIERDRFFEPTSLEEIYNKVKEGIHV